MGDLPPFIIVTVILGLIFQLLNLFGIKIDPKNIKKFIAIRGKTIAWNIYLLIATIITVFFIFSLSVVLTNVSFSIGPATFIVVILWGILGIWTPAIQRLRNKRINTAVQIVGISLVTLMVIGFWIFEWPEIQRPIFVTILLFVSIAIFIVDRILKNRKRDANTPKKGIA